MRGQPSGFYRRMFVLLRRRILVYTLCTCQEVCCAEMYKFMQLQGVCLLLYIWLEL